MPTNISIWQAVIYSEELKRVTCNKLPKYFASMQEINDDMSTLTHSKGVQEVCTKQ